MALRECLCATDIECVSSHAETDGHGRGNGHSRKGGSQPWWFVLVRLWTTVPIIAIAVAAGYAIGGLAVAGVMASTCLVGGFVFSRWARANRARVRARLEREPGYRRHYQERTDRVARLFGWYFAGLGAVTALAVTAWLIARFA